MAAVREQRPDGGRDTGRVSSPTQRNVHGTAPPSRDNGELPRSASYTYLGPAKEGAYEQYGQPNIVEIRIPPANYAVQSELSPPEISAPDTSGCTTPDDHAGAIAPPQACEIVDQLQKVGVNGHVTHHSEDTRSSLESSFRESRTSLESTHTVSTVASTPVSSQRPSINKSFSRRFSKRQSWHQSAPSTSSRSPSPVKPGSAFSSDEAVDGTQTTQQSNGARRKSLLVRRLSGKLTKDNKSKRDAWSSGDEDEAKSTSRKPTFLRRKSTRTAKSAGSEDQTTSLPDIPPVPALPKLPKSFSTDRLPMLRVGTGSADRAAPAPRMFSPDKEHKSNPLSITRKKDELWSVFRSLDGDYAKFASKSSAFKANVVRNSLIPFLRSYANHPSNKTLRPEDLDRRASILNKWWTGLIELLHGSNNRSISGTDRPVILDGASGIMDRPEWRLSPSPFCPLKDRGKASAAGSQSSISLGSTSTSSDFLTESVHHNVRNIFVQNLSSQMAFVVDKMSLRQASASLVAFCGKACAYAFMFVPGVADVLVRLWEIPMETIRRVLSESGIGKFDQMGDLTSDILVNFPPALQQLGFTSLMKLFRRLRTPPPLPLGTNHVDWYGNWVERWSGRESDLFYTFVKQFCILTTDFLPSDATQKEHMCAPGLLLVHSQILACLDATIHREANQAHQGAATPSSSTTFDDLLGDVDATASAFPLLPNNAVRLMAENRLIMLIRDFLSDRASDHPIAREMFAQSFNNLLQAATKGTSMFDHSACYTLLDFLEEAFVILVRYEHLREDDDSLINSPFWQTVCRRMIDSENTMTEIRLYAFLHTVWNVVAPDQERKTELCMNVLLDPEVFESRFNHWCPMVRAYFMRLLCWRVGRYDGDDHSGDLGILEVMQERLQTTWSHYLFLCNKAEREQSLHPVTIPCNPAPSRRLLIVRTDNQVTHNNTFLSFDGILRDGESPTQSKEPPWKRASVAANLIDTIDMRPGSAASSFVDSESDTREKGIGGFLRKMIGSKARSKSQGPNKRTPLEDKPTTSAAAEGPQPVTRAATADNPATQLETSPKPSPAPAPQFRSLSFKFSLEFHPSNKLHPPMRLFPPRLPLAAQVYLQTMSKKFNSNGAVISVRPAKPTGESVARARYAGRALAEWAVVIGECQSFFERRKKEGVPCEKMVETPTLGVEVFKRPG